MKKLLLLILLIAFSYNESKAQDSVTVTFRLNMFNQQITDTFYYFFENDLIEPQIIGNLSDLNATYTNGTALPNFNFEPIYGNWDPEDDDGFGNFSIATLSLKFPISSVGQELSFSFIASFDPNYIVYLEDTSYLGFNENLTSCFSASSQLGLFFNSQGYNIENGLVRTIVIPAQNTTYSYCYSSCLQCNGEAPTLNNVGNLLKTKAFIDLNNNSTLDIGEPGAQGVNVNVNTSPNPSNGFTGNNGCYSVYVPNGEYTVQVAPSNQFTIANTTQNVTVANATAEVFFPVSLAPNYYEVEAVFNPALMVAGFDQTSSIVIQNTGNSVSNLSLTITLPEDQAFVSSIPAPTNIAGGVLTYLIPSIAAYTNFPISITTYLPPPPTFMPGDEITWNLNLSPLPNEESDANNVFSYTLPILSSYDPNDKTMMKGSSITPALVNAGEDFHYRIRFQNTGNFPASFIHVRDTLEAGLNPSSLRMLAASHEYSLTVTDNIYLDWFFPNIQLPDSTSDPEGSQGYILFSIQPVLPVAEGTQIENTAHIYFDFNPAVITNTEVTTIETPASISSTNAAGNVWVNANMELRIQHPTDFNQLNIYSIDGRLLHKTNPTNYFDLKGINTTGMVLIELVGNNNRVVLKQGLMRE